MDRAFAKELARWGPDAPPRQTDPAAALAYCRRFTLAHAENFSDFLRAFEARAWLAEHDDDRSILTARTSVASMRTASLARSPASASVWLIACGAAAALKLDKFKNTVGVPGDLLRALNADDGRK